MRQCVTDPGLLQLPVSCLFITFPVLNIYVLTVPFSDLQLCFKQVLTMGEEDPGMEYSGALHSPSWCRVLCHSLDQCCLAGTPSLGVTGSKSTLYWSVSHNSVFIVFDSSAVEEPKKC